MELVYFGKKQPYTFTIKAIINGKKIPKVFHFTPFKAQEVPDEYGKIIMANGGRDGIFKRLDKDERKPLPENRGSGDGYVGDLPAGMVTNEQKEKELKAEEGKTIEEVIEEGKKKKGKKPLFDRKKK